MVWVAVPVATTLLVASTTCVTTVTDLDTALSLRTRVRALTVLRFGVVRNAQSTLTGSVTIMLTSRTIPPQT